MKAALPRDYAEALPSDVGSDDVLAYAVLCGTASTRTGESLLIRTRQAWLVLSRPNVFDRFARIDLPSSAPFVVEERAGQQWVRVRLAAGEVTLAAPSSERRRLEQLAAMLSGTLPLETEPIDEVSPDDILESDAKPQEPLNPVEVALRTRQVLAQQGNVMAVRAFREMTNASLAEAVAAVDDIAAGRPIGYGTNAVMASHHAMSSPELQMRIAGLVRAGAKNEAVVLLRRNSTMDADQAARAVDGMTTKLGIRPSRGFPKELLAIVVLVIVAGVVASMVRLFLMAR